MLNNDYGISRAMEPDKCTFSSLYAQLRHTLPVSTTTTTAQTGVPRLGGKEMFVGDRTTGER